MLRKDEQGRVVCVWMNCPGFEFKIPITPCQHRVKDEELEYSLCNYWDVKDESMDDHVMQKVRKSIIVDGGS